MAVPALPFRCERTCEALIRSGPKRGRPCENTAAYYETIKKVVSVRCGVHSDVDARRELPKNPNAAQQKEQTLERHRNSVEKARRWNVKHNYSGSIIVSKQGYVKGAASIEGYMKVYPNKYGAKNDGVTAPELSPMNLGPVPSAVKGVPDATCIENYYQASKVYQHEVDDNNVPLPEFYETRERLFEDTEPHRHKFERGAIPLYSVFYSDAGKPLTLTYVESRWFYCNEYERLAQQTNKFRKLLKRVADGYNLQIIGHDGHEIEPTGEETVPETMLRYYEDPSRPFGHELVLFCLLMLEREEFPWVVYRAQHKAVYE